LTSRIYIDNSEIYNAILKYGISNFQLEILEYCNRDSLLHREQYYINTLKPNYNILKIAGSRLGFKCSAETILKLELRGRATILYNTKNNVISKFNSIRAASRSISVNHVTLSSYINKNKLLKNIYLVL
jgi:hypothetical protein